MRPRTLLFFGMKTCIREDCDRPLYAKELCSRHYDEQNRRSHGIKPRTGPTAATCSAEDCDQVVYAKGLCSRHYDLTRKRALGVLPRQPKGVCSEEGCDNPVHAQNICQNHYRQFQRRVQGLRAPGRKRDPSKPHSHFAEVTTCRAGHTYEEGSYKLSANGKRVCLLCLEDRKKTHCPQGHEYTEGNTRLVNGSRQCKQCHAERMQVRRPFTVGPGGVNAAKTHCPQGHEYTDENMKVYDGRRFCVTCTKANGAIQRAKAKGVTLVRIEQMLQEQDHRCAICRDELNGRFDIDHDHGHCDGPYSCGKCIRRLLCPDCNHGLGCFKDNPAIMDAASAYVKSFAELQYLPVLAGVG